MVRKVKSNYLLAEFSLPSSFPGQFEIKILIVRHIKTTYLNKFNFEPAII